MSTVTLAINGQKVTVPAGSTILEAAEKLDIFIPTLCHHPALSDAASCRICVVETQHNGRLKMVPACMTKAADGMEVQTESPEVVENRRAILELLLANHPQDCLTCGRNGDCRLQDYAFLYNVRSPGFTGERHNYEIEDDNPFILRDLNKCILCGRCVRACAEIQGDNVIYFSHRGFAAKVTTAMDMPLSKSECVFCGSCVAVCPVGALQEKDLRRTARTWEIRKVKTICPYCGTGCSIELNVKNNQVVGVTSCDGEVNGLALCVKGRFGYGFIHHPDRLTTPLIRKDGKLVEASWEEAISFTAAKLTEVKNKYGPDSLAVLSSARCTNEENYLLQKFARAVLGSNNIDHCARLCHAPTVAGLTASFGSGAMTNSISEISGADFILAIGTNTTETHPVIGLQIKKALRKGAKLAVVDPRVTRLAEMAQYHLQIKPGTDSALLNGMANVIITEKLWNKNFVVQRTEGFEELCRYITRYTPEYVQEVTGVPAEIIRRAAREYARSKNATILYTMGLTQHANGTQNVYGAANLAMLCGHIGKENSGVNPLRGQNNVQGACDMGALPDVLTGYQKVTSGEVRAKFARAWNVNSLPDRPGLTAGEMLEGAGAGNIKAMYIMGENPVLSDADANHVKEALQKLDFLVVQDIFLTETARLADVVLPAVSFAEKDGTFTNTERRVQKLNQAIKPVGSAKPDWKIICLLSNAMGYPMNYSSTAEIMEEIASVTPSYGGISHHRLEKGGLQWPCPTKNHPGTPVLHKEKFTRGLGKFHPAVYIPPKEQPDNNYPLVLSTGRRLYHYHTGTMSLRTGALEKHYEQEYLEVNPVDAEKYHLSEGCLVKIISRRGEVKLPVKITDKVLPGIVFTSFHFPDAPVNQLTNPARDPAAKIPELKVCAVRLEKI
ncbi:MAG: formate dehydrogenase subunit alpha [Desulfotomaculum sp.]|nr:formate dehydrogenase subunit alpha [Desulfotomaculum sp.]